VMPSKEAMLDSLPVHDGDLCFRQWTDDGARIILREDHLDEEPLVGKDMSLPEYDQCVRTCVSRTASRRFGSGGWSFAQELAHGTDKLLCS